MTLCVLLLLALRIPILVPLHARPEEEEPVQGESRMTLQTSLTILDMFFLLRSYLVLSRSFRSN